jgi:ribonuclease HI
VFSHNGQHAQLLYTILPPHIEEFINNTHLIFNASVEDAFIWSHNKNGIYTAKSGYTWLLSNQIMVGNSHGLWSWIWKIKAPEKYKFLIWLICHDAAPTLALLHHRRIAPSDICSRCNDYRESIMHCIRDCIHSKPIWIKVGFSGHEFFSTTCATEWIRYGIDSPSPTLFLATLWWTWRHRNLMCISHENWSVHHITTNIQNDVLTISSAFNIEISQNSVDRHVRWNCNNLTGIILNVDGSCNGTPIRTGFGGIFRNDGGLFLSAFSGRLPHTEDILLAELNAIYHGLNMAVEMGYNDLSCYSDSLLAINLIRQSTPPFHVYAVLIQNIKDILTSANFSVYHTLREGNHAADFMAKLGSSGDHDIVSHLTPPAGINLLLHNDALGVSFLRA